MGKRYFTPEVFKFLNELEANNDKAWWEANKERYVSSIREPALELIGDMGTRLEGISAHFVADTRVNGGSLMRPYRDIRFSKDKTPYKTNVGIQFRHEMGRDVHAPGFYLHIEPGGCFAGVGLWRPEARVARAIRQAINDDRETWKKATKTKTFTDTWSIDHDEEATLKRVPKEFDQTHPYPDDLRLKTFTAISPLTQKLVTSSELVPELVGRYGRARGFARFLCDAIGLPF